MKSLISSSILYTLGRVIPQVVSFILLPVYTFYISTEDFGIINSMQVLSAIIVLFFTCALDRGVLRMYYDFDSALSQKVYLGTISISIFIISTLFLTTFFLFSEKVNLIYSSVDFYPFYSLTLLTCYLEIFSLIPLIYLQIKDEPVIYISLNFLKFIVGVLLTLYYIIELNAGALGIIKAIFISNLIVTPIYLYYAFRSFSFKFDLKMLTNTFKFTLPILPTLLSAWVLNLSDRIFIDKYFNMSDVGIYSLGSKISGSVLILFGAFTLAYSPYFYEKAKSKDNFKDLFTFNKQICLVFLFISFSLFFLSEEVINFFFNVNYYESIYVIKILTMHTILSVFLGILNLMYYQSKATLPLLYIFITGAVLNVFLNFILIPNFSFIGASYATVLSFLVMFLIQLRFAKDYYYIPFDWKSILSIIIVFVSLYYLFDLLTIQNAYFSVFTKCIVLIFVFFIFIGKNNSLSKLIFSKNK
jgi:O-antigen/teichoic acid export membrane protein